MNRLQFPSCQHLTCQRLPVAARSSARVTCHPQSRGRCVGLLWCLDLAKSAFGPRCCTTFARRFRLAYCTEQSAQPLPDLQTSLLASSPACNSLRESWREMLFQYLILRSFQKLHKKNRSETCKRLGRFHIDQLSQTMFVFGQPLARLVGKITSIVGRVNRCFLDLFLLQPLRCRKIASRLATRNTANSRCPGSASLLTGVPNSRN
jgi:hypothetical protein